MSCNHHLSHALSVACTSPFDRSIVLVLDGGGNTLTLSNYDEWWTTTREQQTYFVHDRDSLRKLGTDFEAPYAAGFGEVFRAFTYFLGWESSRHAGNVMALAAHGDPDKLGASRLFSRDELGNLTCPIENDPKNPIQMAKMILDVCGAPTVKPRQANQPIRAVHADIASWLQSEFERALCDTVDSIIERTGVFNVCLTGGVAYNCKSIHTLRSKSRAEEIYVAPASGDQGQCLGNAIFGQWKIDGKIPRLRRFSPFLGPRYRIDKGCIFKLLGEERENLVIRRASNLVETVVKLISLGNIVGWYQGRSEFGPRALGNRSILASPSLTSIRDRLNRAKGRDSFMPFAPSVLDEEVETYFLGSPDLPYMTEVCYIRGDRSIHVEGALNMDGSARIHTVKRSDNERFYLLLSEFFRQTGIPMVLNTSFNGTGEPIVETIKDALECFSALSLDALVIGDFIVYDKRVEMTANDKISLEVGGREFSETAIWDLVSMLSAANVSRTLVPRDKFLLHSKFLDWIRQGRKTTTIRFRRGAVEYPVRRVLPLFVTEDFSRVPRSNQEGHLQISGLEVKAFDDLDESDAKRDGFGSAGELRRVLSNIYGSISPSEYLVIYSLDLDKPYIRDDVC